MTYYVLRITYNVLHTPRPFGIHGTDYAMFASPKKLGRREQTESASGGGSGSYPASAELM